MLVDSLPPVKGPRLQPLHRDSMLRYWQHCLPAHLDAEAPGYSHFDLSRDVSNTLQDPLLRGLFLDADRVVIKKINAFLPPCIVLNAWRYNATYLEGRINLHRHDAIANPSLDTFDPLTSLRRNIAHLEDAVMEAKRDVGSSLPEKHKIVVANVDEGRAILEAQYDILLQQVRSMSKALNNEIQLVIGSVTVRVSCHLIIWLHSKMWLNEF